MSVTSCLPKSPAGWYRIGARKTDHKGWVATKQGDGSSGFAYDCWEGHSNMPCFDLSNPEVRQLIFSVAKFYLEEVGIDGWRLDVAHQIDPTFWAEFRAECKAAKPDCLLVGELMHGNYTTWVGPNHLDSATNFQLSHALWSSLNHCNMNELAEVRG